MKKYLSVALFLILSAVIGVQAVHASVVAAMVDEDTATVIAPPALEDRLNLIGGDFTPIYNRLDGLDSNVETISNRLDGVEGELEGIDLSSIENSISNLNQEVSTITNQVNGLNEGLGTVSTNVAGLSNRVTNVETELGTVSTNIYNLSNRVSNVETGLSTVSTNVAGLSNRVSNVETGLNTANTNFFNLSNRVSNVETGLSTANTNIYNLSNRVSNVETGLSTANTNIYNLSNRVTNVEGRTEKDSIFTNWLAQTVTVLGRDVKAKDAGSVGQQGAAFGVGSSAGMFGLVAGFQNSAGYGAFAAGSRNSASTYGLAVGIDNVAGIRAVALGVNAKAGRGSFTFNSWDGADPVVVTFDRSAYTKEFAVNALGGTLFVTPTFQIIGNLAVASNLTVNGKSVATQEYVLEKVGAVQTNLNIASNALTLSIGAVQTNLNIASNALAARVGATETNLNTLSNSFNATLKSAVKSPHVLSIVNKGVTFNLATNFYFVDVNGTLTNWTIPTPAAGDSAIFLLEIEYDGTSSFAWGGDLKNATDLPTPPPTGFSSYMIEFIKGDNKYRGYP